MKKNQQCLVNANKSPLRLSANFNNLNNLLNLNNLINLSSLINLNRLNLSSPR
jgi:hypothetical protein